jgi:hypothetical protein
MVSPGIPTLGITKKSFLVLFLNLEDRAFHLQISTLLFESKMVYEELKL